MYGKSNLLVKDRITNWKQLKFVFEMACFISLFILGLGMQAVTKSALACGPAPKNDRPNSVKLSPSMRSILVKPSFQKEHGRLTLRLKGFIRV